MEEREEEGNFQGHGSLSGSFLSSADGDTHKTHANVHTAHPSGHDGCRTSCVCVPAHVCLALMRGTRIQYGQTHLFCPSQSSGYPASQPRQERVTALCQAAVTSLSHISSCHSLQGEKGRGGGGVRALLCQTPLSLLCVLFFSLCFISVFFLVSFSHCVTHTLSLPCCVTCVLCKYQMLDSTSITSRIPPLGYSH